VVASSGDVDGSPTVVLPLRAGDPDWQDYRLELLGGRTTADDQRVLRVLADQLAVALETERLTRDAAEAGALAEVDAVRTALLRAVSHDLRTPLASIKAMVSGLRDPSVNWTAEQLAEGLATIDSETDRLNRLVGNLLDASRLQIGALAVERRPTDVAEIVASAVESLALTGSIDVDVDAALPLVDADPALLERTVANLVSNSVRFSPRPGSVRVDAEVVGETVLLRVVDRGPGIPLDEHVKVLAPFQRLGDQPSASGVGLGLSIAQGFVHAMGASMTLDDTPGGGLTVTITLRPA
jgi:two-component system sensor histidine kinase KdpD